MKNRHIILIFTALTALIATSCNKFLDEVPDSRTELDNNDKIRKILTSAYPDRTYGILTGLMSDDHDDIGTGYGMDYEPYMSQAWNWEPITEEDDDSTKEIWASYYLAIANANHALQAIEELGYPENLNPERGEALIARAYSHFILVNLFCQQYSEENGGKDLGIPYIEAPETEVKPQYSRGTVKDVYEKIERDILAALPLIDDNIYTVPKYHFNRLAAYGFAAEFYLYYRKKDGSNLDKVIEYANLALGSNPENMLRDVSGFNAIPDDDKGLAYIDPTLNSNLLLMANASSIGLMVGPWVFGKRYMHNEYISRNETLFSGSVLWQAAGGAGSFILQPSSYATTPTFHARMTVPYLFEYTDPVAQIGYRHSVTIAVSADNVLLNRAEAYVLKEDYASAMADINLWVKKRIAASYAQPKTEEQVDNYYGNLAYYEYNAPTPKKRMRPEIPFANDKQENLIHAILHIRRIEFWGEGKRWFDIRRYNIEISRRQYRVNNIVTEQDKLQTRDKRMAMQLPVGVISAGMEPNPR